MPKHNFLQCLMYYYRKKAFNGTLRRIYEQPYRFLFKGRRLLYYTDMNGLNDSVLNLPHNIIIECKNVYNEDVLPEKKKITDFWDKERMNDYIRERFKKRVILWIVKANEDIAGFGRAIRGNMVHPFSLPLKTHDAVLFDFVKFEEYSGQGLYALLLNFILGKLKLEGENCAYVFNRHGTHRVLMALKKLTSLSLVKRECYVY